MRLPDDSGVSGVVLSDQIRNLDWRARKVEFIAQAQEELTQEVLRKLSTLLV